MQRSSTLVLQKRIEGEFVELLEQAGNGDTISVGYTGGQSWRVVEDGFILRNVGFFHFQPFINFDTLTFGKYDVNTWQAHGRQIAFARGEELFVTQRSLVLSLGRFAHTDYRLTEQGLLVRKGDEIFQLLNDCREPKILIQLTGMRGWDFSEGKIFTDNSVNPKLVSISIPDNKKSEYPRPFRSNWQISGRYIVGVNEEGAIFARPYEENGHPKKFGPFGPIKHWESHDHGVFFEDEGNEIKLLVLK